MLSSKRTPHSLVANTCIKYVRVDKHKYIDKYIKKATPLIDYPLILPSIDQQQKFATAICFSLMWGKVPKIRL